MLTKKNLKISLRLGLTMKVVQKSRTFESWIERERDMMRGLFKMRWAETEYYALSERQKSLLDRILASYFAAKTSRKYQMPKSWDDMS